MINILKTHTLNTTVFIFLLSKHNAMIVFADRLFKSVSVNFFKSWRFEKHVSKSYFKITSL
jgi:hypothetical protein